MKNNVSGWKKLIIVVAISLIVFSINVSATDICLLVKNAGNLDAEEQAAITFAQGNGFSAALIGGGMVKSDPGVLDTCKGYWADSYNEPTTWNDVTVINALKSRIEGGKHLLGIGAGLYIAQYMGYGTATSWSWDPVVNDQVFLVNYDESSHEIFKGLSKWDPSSGQDNPEQALWRVDYPRGSIMFGLTPSGQYKDYTADILWTRYGYCTGDCARFMEYSTVLFTEITAGNGKIIRSFPLLANEWRYKTMGQKFLKNELNWAKGGGTMSTTTTSTTTTSTTTSTTTTTTISTTTTTSTTTSTTSTTTIYSSIYFSGYYWTVIQDENNLMPPNDDESWKNYFSGNSQNVWIDNNTGYLHLKIVERNGKKFCAFIQTAKTLGYGTYTFRVGSRLDNLDPSVDATLFVFDYSGIPGKREIDLEFAKMDTPENAQYAVQPSDFYRFNVNNPSDDAEYYFSWYPDEIYFNSYYSSNSENHYLRFTDANHVPKVNAISQYRASINLWLYKGWNSPTGQDTELIIKNFTYLPLQPSDLKPALHKISYPVKKGEKVNLVADISNIGNGDAYGVIARFFDGDPLNNKQIGSDQTINKIPAHETQQAKVAWEVPQDESTGNHMIYVVVKQDEGIKETDYNNNQDEMDIDICTHKVAYITVKYSSCNHCDTITNSINNLIDRVNTLEDYYKKQSNGKVSMAHFFVFNDWTSLGKSFESYGPPSTEPGGSGWESVMNDAIQLSGINENDWDSVVVIQPYPIQPFTFGNRQCLFGQICWGAIDKKIILGESASDTSTIAHEIGHGVFKFDDLYSYKDSQGRETHRGEIENWGLMGRGSLEFSSPLITFNKVQAGWLADYWTTSWGSLYLNSQTFSLPSLGSMASWQKPVLLSGYNLYTGYEEHFILEARDEDVYKSGVLIYRDYANFLENLPPQMGTETDKKIKTTLDEQSPTYIDQDSLLKFECISGICINQLNKPTEVKVSSAISLFANSKGVIATEMPQQGLITSESNYWNNLTNPNLDLHAYAPDGRHIGMNYTSGLYENQIPGAIASGDMFAEQWIFVPKNISVRWVVDSHDVAQYLKEINSTENLSLNYSFYEMSYGSNPSVEVVNDSVVILGRNVTQPVNKTIGPGITQILSEITTTTTTTTRKTTTSTRSTTTTTKPLPIATVYGNIITKNQLYVPNASVSVKCDKTGGSVAGISNAKGYYSLNISCPYSTNVTISASSGPVRICLTSALCTNFSGGSGVTRTKVSSVGYAVANVVLTTSTTTTSSTLIKA